ncbi:YlxM family DNA-binding protein [uncultured Thomasclavelia sp.]|uniref:YlxM family DNA-binding protein n=1 Tax=uncultured Thomasclavelia sp. TaxID=3025759 RepID=UPI0025E95FCA|nr:sigma factor-like helix-turn-helix DNA-binding protein [uncultured Thomasclavelia sp.]
MESSLEKTQRVNLLIDCYGDLLTNKQQLYLQYYYQEDYSLSEIAEIMHVSRNAVYDNLKKAVRSLEKYEEKLQLMKKHQERLDLIQRIEDDITDENKELENYLEMLRKI